MKGDLCFKTVIFFLMQRLLKMYLLCIEKSCFLWLQKVNKQPPSNHDAINGNIGRQMCVAYPAIMNKACALLPYNHYSVVPVLSTSWKSHLWTSENRQDQREDSPQWLNKVLKAGWVEIMSDFVCRRHSGDFNISSENFNPLGPLFNHRPQELSAQSFCVPKNNSGALNGSKVAGW